MKHDTILSVLPLLPLPSSSLFLSFHSSFPFPLFLPPLPHTPPGSNCQRESNCWTLLNVLCSDCLCLHPTEHRIRQNVGDSGHHRECSSNAHYAQFTRYSTQLLTLICSTFLLPYFLSFPLPPHNHLSHTLMHTRSPWWKSGACETRASQPCSRTGRLPS